jgi:hypothetical protein
MKKILVILLAVIGFGFSANAQKKCIKEGVCYVEVSKTSSTTVSIAIDDTKNQITLYVNVEQTKDKDGGYWYNVFCTGYRKVVGKATLSGALVAAINTVTSGTTAFASGIISATGSYAYDKACEYLKENNY